MVSWFLKRVFGSRNERLLKKMWPLVERINELEESYQGLSDEQLKAKTQEFRERLERGESTDDLLPEAYAVVKNTCRRMLGEQVQVTGHTVVWEMVPYDVQLLGGIALHRGGIAEMQTGEGKTLVAVMPLYLNALTGRNCQLVTTNDYLARRDSEWVGAVLQWLGLTVGCIQHDMRPAERREMYRRDVTYGTNSEFGFDYLRDMGMATEREELVQRDHFFCIIDEVDNILIDEARTPLIISGPSPVSTHRYDQLKPSVERLFKKQSLLCTRLITEAKAVLQDDDSDADTDDAVMKLMRVRLGMPKHKQLMRLLEDPQIRRLMDKKDSEVHSDQNRGLLQEVKETLYFTIDERAGDADLSEMGRSFLSPDNPDAFVLPDLATQLSELDGRTDLDDEARTAERATMQQHFDEQSETIHNISQLLRAYCLFEKDVQYIIEDNKVVIVDEFTGRKMPGRRFSEGLHQALEAKEGVAIERETQTLATVTIQNYFRMYEKLAGMTGTAETESAEFKDIYGLEVLVIPTNRPCVRIDEDDRVFKTMREKYSAIVEDVREAHTRGQPVLLGTVSVEVSEILSRMLRREKIVHSVLNAKNHQHEAEIVARAGQLGAVTIATNMAGRGTDIRLGEGVQDLGGLRVIGSSRHDSRRIDRQLRGRCARQGDPGVSGFYVSLEDDLMRLFGSSNITGWLERLGFEDGEELSHPWLNRSIENAQRRVEQQHFSVRKHTLQYDDVMNKQREVIYGRRKEVLFSEETRELLFRFVDTAIYDHLSATVYERPIDGAFFDRDQVFAWLKSTFPIAWSDDDLVQGVGGEKFDPEALVAHLVQRIDEAYQIKERGEEPDALRWLERQFMLAAHDRLWQQHLDAMDDLRDSIRLRAYAQRDPLVEYKQEAFGMFAGLVNQVNDEICSNMFRSATSLNAFQNLLDAMPTQGIHQVFGQFDNQAEPQTAPEGPEGWGAEAPLPGRPKGMTYHREEPKVGRNDPCPCGSQKKFKKCCGR